MLRYYDAIGLLKPAETDRFTDYRYYSEAQLPMVCRITALRDMGFPLAEVPGPVAGLRRLRSFGCASRPAPTGTGSPAGGGLPSAPGSWTAPGDA